ncbi:hypothetical protein D9M71_378700 [compost metagenome]
MLQAGNQLFDFFGRLLRALGQAAHFVGNHGKATACLAGTRCLDRCVERQQVGLFGHRLDHVHHATNFLAFLLQQVHGLGGTVHVFGQAFDLANRFAHHAVAGTGFVIGTCSCM